MWSRTGYLISGMRPDLTGMMAESFEPRSKVRFGPRAKAIRNDKAWKVSDTTLPFDPKKLEAVI